MIGNMFQQQLLQTLSSLINVNGKRPAHVLRGAPGTEGSSGRERHCFYCGKSNHYIADCPKKRSDEDRGVLAIGWRPQEAQESSALAIMGNSQTVHSHEPQRANNVTVLPNTSPYVHSNARDLGPQPKMH
ncbi:hypothetical protein EDC01DRAFT_627082 [Geopyxis carbonaria]|nr:hypothetical protein EDC01DRAFT_627082 [Geopyxis carbonaria]